MSLIADKPDTRTAELHLGPDMPLAERLLAIGKDCAARLGEAVLSIDHGRLLYGDDGLPR